MLTSFLVWPLLLAWLLPPWTYWHDPPTMLGYLAIILLSSLTTTILAMFCSVIFRKTSVSTMASYLVLIVLFTLPLAALLFVQLFFQGSAWETWVFGGTFTSPFAAAFNLPLSLRLPGVSGLASAPDGWQLFRLFVGFYVALDMLLIWAMIRMFEVRWRVSG